MSRLLQCVTATLPFVSFYYFRYFSECKFKFIFGCIGGFCERSATKGQHLQRIKQLHGIGSEDPLSVCKTDAVAMAYAGRNNPRVDEPSKSGEKVEKTFYVMLFTIF